jgi:hypothetical protein
MYLLLGTEVSRYVHTIGKLKLLIRMYGPQYLNTASDRGMHTELPMNIWFETLTQSSYEVLFSK